jgi:uroporphyrinogen-III synthase
MGAQSRPAILLTRPAPAARRFARSLRHALGPGLRVCIAPLITPRPIHAPVPRLLAAPTQPLIVFTAEEGVAGFVRNWPVAGLRALCVGPRTTAVARAAGFDATAVPGGTAQALLDMLLIADPQPVVVIRGREAAHDLAAGLTAAGRSAEAATVYAQEAQPLGARAQALLHGSAPVVVPVFSARSAALLTRAASGASAPLWLAAIGPAAVTAATPLAPARVQIAPTPDAAGMRAAVAVLMSMCHNTT